MINNKYKKDYERIETGQYKYVGRYYILPMTEIQKKKTNWFHAGFMSAFFVLLILAGLVNQDSSHTAWIVFPYLFLFLPSGYMAVGTFSYWNVHVRMQLSEYENSLMRLKKSCIAILVLSVFNILLDSIFLILHFSEINARKEGFYMLWLILLVILSIFYGKQYDRLYSNITID